MCIPLQYIYKKYEKYFQDKVHQNADTLSIFKFNFSLS